MNIKRYSSRFYKDYSARFFVGAAILALILLAPLAAATLFSGFYKEYPRGVVWSDASDIAAIISGLATALGVLAASWAFFGKSRDERDHREDQTHYEMNGRYADYLEVSLAHPELPVQDYGEDSYWMSKVEGNSFVNDRPRELNDLTYLEYKQTVAIYEMIFTMMERAYLTYADHEDDFRKRQWGGWNQYIRDWFGRSDFSTVWLRHIRSTENDSNFTKYIEEVTR